MSVSILPYRDKLGVKDPLNFIAGEWVPGSSGEWMEQIHPASNEVVARFAVASNHDVDRAVMAARQASDDGAWSRLPARDRIKLLRRFVDLAEAAADELTELQVLDNGQPIVAPRAFYLVSGHGVGAVFDHFIGWIDKLCGSTYPTYAAADAALTAMTVREPVGVVAAITAWNSPIFLLCQKIAPALAAGCTVVIKPSEHSTLATQRIVRLFQEADFPPGVVNLVNGPGATTGEALVAHPGVDKISFTGSDVVGKHIMRTAADSIKRVSLELGGKSPLIVLADTPDPRLVGASAMAFVSTGMSGQTCAATTRVLVHESIYDSVIAGAESAAPRVKFGDPYDTTTTSAPLISKKQMNRVQGFVDGALQDGVRLVTGGGRSRDEMLANGNWFLPTLLADVDNAMAVARNEIFGPVLSVIPFKDEAEAIRIANDTRFGLAARIASGNQGKALALARRLRAGSIGVNCYGLAPNIPFGGMRESGIGREGGWEAICAYTESKTILLATGQ